MIAIGFGLFFAGRATWDSLTDEDVRWLIILGPGAVAIALFLPALFRSDAVIADGKLSGPGSLVGPLPWYNRNTIRLSNIRFIGAAPYDYTFAEAHDGSRVYIVGNCPGSAALIERLKAAAEAPNAQS